MRHVATVSNHIQNNIVVLIDCRSVNDLASGRAQLDRRRLITEIRECKSAVRAKHDLHIACQLARRRSGSRKPVLMSRLRVPSIVLLMRYAHMTQGDGETIQYKDGTFKLNKQQGGLRLP